MTPEEKKHLFYEFSNFVEGCAPDALQSMYFDPNEEKCWEVDMQMDLLLGSFIAYDEDIGNLWSILNWDERRGLVHEWGKTADPIYG